MNVTMHRAEVRTMVLLLIAATSGGGAGLCAQTAGQKTFASSKDALSAFVQAVSTDNTADLAAILSAHHFVQVRTTPGGPAPSQTSAAIARSREELTADRQWHQDAEAHVAGAVLRLKARVANV